MNASDYIVQLEQIISHLSEERDSAFQKIIALEAEIKTLAHENETLQKRIRFYENPHSPPSVDTLTRRKPRKTRANYARATGKNRRGAPAGHRGAARKTPAPDEVVVVTAAQCPCCEQALGEPYATETKMVEELPPPQKIRVIQFDLKRYNCPHCGLDFATTHEACPQEGHFGPYLLVYMTMLKYFMRGSKILTILYQI